MKERPSHFSPSEEWYEPDFPRPMGVEPEDMGEQLDQETQQQLKEYIENSIEENKALTWEAIDNILSAINTNKQPKLQAKALTNEEIDELLEFGDYIRQYDPKISIREALDLMDEMKANDTFEHWMEFSRNYYKAKHTIHDPEQEIGELQGDQLDYDEWEKKEVRSGESHLSGIDPRTL